MAFACAWTFCPSWAKQEGLLTSMLWVGLGMTKVRKGDRDSIPKASSHPPSQDFDERFLRHSRRKSFFFLDLHKA